VINYSEVTDLNDPALVVFSQLNEIQLKRYYEPAEGLFICESPKVIRRALDGGYDAVSLLLEPKYLEGEDADITERVALNPAVPVYTAPLEVLSNLTGYHLTGGMLCAMRRKILPSAEELLSEIRRSNKESHHIRIAVFEDVENPTNIGAMFRSAAALGIDAVLLTDGCSDPLYRRAARVSVGTVFQIPWTWIGSQHYLDSLHCLGFKTAAMALSDKTISIDDPDLKTEEKLAILLGNEGNGLLPETISKSDYVVKIPMPDGIDSLNVAAASAVAFWELRK